MVGTYRVALWVVLLGRGLNWVGQSQNLFQPWRAVSAYAVETHHGHRLREEQRTLAPKLEPQGWCLSTSWYWLFSSEADKQKTLAGEGWSRDCCRLICAAATLGVAG